MASSAGIVKAVLLAVIAVAVGVAPVAEAAISCSSVVGTLRPCLGYVQSGNVVPPAACCGGIKSVNAAAKTTPDRQSVCMCLKSVAGSFGTINYGKVAGLPGKCGVNIPYKIDPSTDCAKVH